MEIPPQAKRVFQGVIFEVYQWEQKMFDGTTEIFEAIKRPGTVQVIPTIGNKILLAYEEQPGKPRAYSLFGGRMEKDEEPIHAIKRELLEETGMESIDWELYKEYIPEGKIEWPMYVYIARDCKKVTEPKLDAGEKIEIKEVTVDAFLEIVCREDFWGSNVSLDMLRIKQDPQKLATFKAKLF